MEPRQPRGTGRSTSVAVHTDLPCAASGGSQIGSPSAVTAMVRRSGPGGCRWDRDV